MVPALSLARVVLRVFFHDVRGIGQQDVDELDGGGIGEDRAAIAIAHKTRQPAGVIEMRVREHDEVDGGDIERLVIPIALAQFARALK